MLCRLSPSLRSSDVFLVVGLELSVLGRNVLKVECHSHHIMSRHVLSPWLITDDINLDPLAEVSVVNLPCSPLFVLWSLEDEPTVKR